jgi:hypothetical protein
VELIGRQEKRWRAYLFLPTPQRANNGEVGMVGRRRRRAREEDEDGEDEKWRR